MLRDQTKKFLLPMILVGLILVGGGLIMRVLAAPVPSDIPGETLEMVNYVYLGDEPKGVFLGTYAVGLGHCAWYDLVTEGADTKLHCYTTYQGETVSGEVQATGFGIIYLEYPDQCPVTGFCISVTKTHIMMPVGSNYNLSWRDCNLTGASSIYGHDWTGSCSNIGPGQVNVRQVLGDFDQVRTLPGH